VTPIFPIQSFPDLTAPYGPIPGKPLRRNRGKEEGQTPPGAGVVKHFTRVIYCCNEIRRCNNRIQTLSILELNATLSISTLRHYAECCDAECIAFSCYYIQFRYAQCHNAECHYARHSHTVMLSGVMLSVVMLSV
jgi:hypothetical protein